MTKKIFTIIELLFVLLLLGLFFSILGNFNTSKEKEKVLSARSCVNSIVGKLSNYIYQAFTSKSIYVDGKDIIPEKYIISFLKPYNVKLKYFLNNTGDYNDIDLTNIRYNAYGCEGVYFSGKNYDIVMWRGFKSSLTHGGFEIYDGNQKVLTGEIKFYFRATGFRHRYLGKLYIDSRAQQIYYYSCEIWSGGNLLECKKYR